MKTVAECSKFITDIHARQVLHSYDFSIDNMNDRELRESIIDDLLTVTMMERVNNITMRFGYSQLFKLLLRSQLKRVTNAMKHDEINGLINRYSTSGYPELRIHTRKEILQTAMEYCGAYYEGFSIPDGVTVYSLSGIGQVMIEEMGVENTAALIVSEFTFGQQTSTTKH